MRKLLALVLMVSAVTAVIAHDYSDNLYNRLENGQYEEADSVLTIWQAAAKDDPELYPARFNLLLNRAHQSYIAVDTDTAPQGEYFVFSDSTGNPVGSIHPVSTWNDSLVSEALKIINEGISVHPDRLDFRFGKATLCMYVENWDEMTATAIAALDRSKVNNDNWLWTDGEAVDSADSKAVFLEGIHDYERALAQDNCDNQQLLDYNLTLYPNDEVALTLKSSLAYQAGNLPEALELTTRAHIAAPHDRLVTCNLGFLNLKSGNDDEALKIYRSVFDDPDAEPEWKEQAEYYIQLIEKGKAPE